MKRLTLVLAASLCFLILAPSGHTGASKDVWTRVRSRNFVLVGSASEKEIRQVALRLEQFREASARLFIKANISSPVPTTVVVFKSDAAYHPFQPNPNTAGYFQSGSDVNYITLTTETRSEQSPFGVIFHEFTHLLVNNTWGNVPVWLNEGLAEYYSTFAIRDDQRVVLGRPIAAHVALLRDNKLFSLRKLFKADQRSAYYNEIDKQGLFYAESWAFVHYLILGRNGQRLSQLAKFLELLDSNVPLERAFEQAFQTSIDAMERELESYIEHYSSPVISGRLEIQLGSGTEMQSAPISEAEVQAYLGDLLLHSNRVDAEGYLQKALTLDPQLGTANASLGMLRLRQGKIDEARRRLEDAVAADSQNYLIHYYYAFVLSREGMDENQTVIAYPPEIATHIRAELQQAMELRPDFPESYILLAFVNLVTDSQLDESIGLLKRVLAMSPGRKELLLTLTQIYTRRADFKAARQILERLSQNNSDLSIRRQAESLLIRLTEKEAQTARLRATRTFGGEKNGSGLAAQSGGFSEYETVEAPADPSATLQAALRMPGAGEKRIQGSLVLIECNEKGITFVVRVDDQLVSLHTDRFEQVRRVAFSADAGRVITCGPRQPENAVVICYLPATDARSKFAGTIKSIEFVPSDFRLKV
jgi:hypothetical protein